MVTRSILRPVLRPVTRAVSDTIRGFNPRSLFASGEQGIWLDPSDFSTLFQDAAGTTPVTAVGQPVGLALDKRLGLALGSELVSNPGPFTATTGWTASAAVLSTSSGSLIVTNSSAGIYAKAQATITTIAGAWYKVNVTAQAGTLAPAVWVGTSVGGSQLLALYGVIGQTKTAYFLAQGTTTHVQILGSNVLGETAAVSLVSSKLIAGNHAYQTTLAARQTAQSNYLSLDKTDDHLLVAAGGAGTTGFLLVAGVVVPAAGTARTLWSDRGTNTGYKVGIDASNQIFLSAGNGAAFVTATGPALVAGTKYVITAWHDGANLNVSVNNGAPTQAAFVTATAGTATFTIGKSNGAATEYWGDRIYSMVYRKNDRSNAGQRSGLYSYMVGKMGGL